MNRWAMFNILIWTYKPHKLYTKSFISLKKKKLSVLWAGFWLGRVFLQGVGSGLKKKREAADTIFLFNGWVPQNCRIAHSITITNSTSKKEKVIKLIGLDFGCKFFAKTFTYIIIYIYIYIYKVDCYYKFYSYIFFFWEMKWTTFTN